MDDLISRKAAIEVLAEMQGRCTTKEALIQNSKIWQQIKALPSAQPEIIRCKDCKYQDENWRRVSVRWLPCMDMRTGSNWYCGYAERRTDERSDLQTGGD